MRDRAAATLPILSLLAWSALASATEAERSCIDRSARNEQKLACLDGVSFRETANPRLPQGARQFDLRYTQPVDHARPAAGTFTQRLALIHRDEREPLVLQTSGYQLSAVALTALASTF